jgi:hypothetical protein
MDELLAARVKLIQRYVLAGKAAWGVAICGGEDVLNGDDYSFLTIYVYDDSLEFFVSDFDAFATPLTPGGYLGIDGITVAVQVIKKPKPIKLGQTPPTFKARR